MKAGDFFRIVTDRKNSLIQENERILTEGRNKQKYQLNCNQLKGIDFVLELLKRVKIK